MVPQVESSLPLKMLRTKLLFLTLHTEHMSVPCGEGEQCDLGLGTVWGAGFQQPGVFVCDRVEKSRVRCGRGLCMCERKRALFSCVWRWREHMCPEEKACGAMRSSPVPQRK